LCCGIKPQKRIDLISRIKLKNLVEDGDTRATEIEGLLAEPNKF